MAGIEHSCAVSVSAFSTVIVRISKTNTKSLTVGKKSARNLIYPVSSLIFFESLGFKADWSSLKN